MPYTFEDLPITEQCRFLAIVLESRIIPFLGQIYIDVEILRKLVLCLAGRSSRVLLTIVCARIDDMPSIYMLIITSVGEPIQQATRQTAGPKHANSYL